MGKCKDCLYWAPGRLNWGYCDGWVPEHALFNIIDLRSVDNNHLEMETHADFGCSGFEEPVEHDFPGFPEGLD